MTGVDCCCCTPYRRTASPPGGTVGSDHTRATQRRRARGRRGPRVPSQQGHNSDVDYVTADIKDLGIEEPDAPDEADEPAEEPEVNAS